MLDWDKGLPDASEGFPKIILAGIEDKRMKVLITGSDGFVGKETIKLLEKKDIEVIPFDIMSGRDIRDLSQLDYIFKEYAPDRVLHLGAIARFTDADADPKLAFETNVLGTRNVTLMCKKYHVPLVYSSTGSCYMPINNEPPITEEFPVKGNSVYGCSKTMGELYVKEHTPHIILRYAHLYGAEKRGHGLIGGFLDRINRGLEPKLFGGKQSNDFLYIKDVAHFNYRALIADWDKWNQAYNVGTGEELSAEEAGKLVCKVFNYKGKIEKVEGREVDASRFVYDMTKTHKMLGYKHYFNFEKGLKDMKKEIDNDTIRQA